MKITCGRFILSVAIFTSIVQLTLAAVSGTDCTNDATKCVAHSTCVGTNCQCNAAYKEGTGDAEDTCVLKAVSDYDCTGDATVCNAIANSACSGSNNCQCTSAFKEGTAENVNKCVLKGLNDTCSGGVTDCSNVTGATCNSNIKCACEGSFKVDPADSSKCKRKGLGDSCAIHSDCDGVTNSKCSTGTTKICECDTEFTAFEDICQKGLNNTCSSDFDCKAVDNAECDSTSKRCVCKVTHMADNGKCSKASGLQTLMSAPVALLLSFLTIVVTRLH